MSMTIRLTPLVEPLQRAAFEEFSQLLSVDVLRWEDRSRHEGERAWALLLELSSGLAIELTPPSRGRAFATGAALEMSYRNLPNGQDPMGSEPHRAELARLAALVERLTTDRLRPALEALTRWQQFNATDDYMFVQARRGEVAVIRLGFRCNQDCGFCWQGRRWPDTPTDLVFTWVDEILASGIHRINLSGGEPTLYRDLARVIAHARDLGATVNIQTNAIRMGKRAYVDSLVEAGLSAAFVSFHSADPDVSDSMTRAPRTHERSVAGIENLLHAGIRVRLNCVVEKRNYAQLQQHAEMIVERFVRPFADNPLNCVEYSHPSRSYDPSFYDEMSVPLDVVKPHLLTALRILRAAGVTTKAVGTCGFPPCLLAEAPELLTRMDPSAQHEMDTVGREYVDACEQCSMRDHCMGVRREYVARFGSRGLTPFTSKP